MTDEQINTLLAEEVMKFLYADDAYYLDNENGDYYCEVEDWQPTQNIEQALMCAEKFCDGAGCYMTINYYYTEIWQVRIWNEVSLLETDADIEVIASDKKLELAICSALLEAVKE